MSFEFSSEPLKVGQILDQGIKLFLGSFSSMVPIIGLMIITGMLAAFVVPIENPADITLSSMLSLIIFGLIQIFLSLVILYRCLGYAAGQGQSLAEAFELSSSRFIKIAGFYVLYALVVTVGFILLVVPGLILTVTLMLGSIVILLEGIGPVAALKRSHSLVWGGNYWRSTLVLIVATMFFMVVLIAAGIVTGIVGFALGQDNMVVMTKILEAILNPILQPLFVCLMLVLYKDLVARQQN